MAYPLRHFTDDDVWKLTKAYDIPVNRLMYGSVDEPKMDTENIFNPDYVPYCLACLDPLEPEFVKCPKFDGLEVSNISESINKVDPKLAYCSGGK